MHSIKIENISAEDYLRLQQEAAGASAHLGKPISLRNYVRLKLGLSPAKRGNPTGNKGRKINQRKRKQ